MTGLALAALGAIVGCRHETQRERLGRQGILSIALESDTADLDPNTNIDSSNDITLASMFEGLVEVGPDAKTILPGVADRWQISGDGLTYTFHLRPDARWSNGAPVTSEDFLFSFRRVFDPLLASESASFGFAIAGSEAYATGKSKDLDSLGLAAPDPSTFVIRLAHPAPYFLSILGASTPFKPVYRPNLEAFGGVHSRGTAWTKAGNLVSNGPFTLARWEPGKGVEVRKNPYYWDRAHVMLEGIHFIPIDDPGVQERGFRSGEFHLTSTFPSQKAEGYDAGSGGQLLIQPIRRSVFLTFNVSKAPFGDPRVRRALSLALDRKALVAAIFHRTAEPATSQVRPGIGGYQPRVQDAYLPNSTLARELLSQAGFPGGQGLPTIDLMLVGSSTETRAVGEVIQARWKEILGITTQLSPTENKVYLDAERSKHYEVIVDSWGCPWDDPSAFFQTAQSGNPNNDSGWSNAEFDRAYRAAEQTTSKEERTRLFDRQEEILAAEVPYAPLYFATKCCLIAREVRGYDPNGEGSITWTAISLAP